MARPEALRIYRTVNPNELEDIRRTGRYRLGPGNEGKPFFVSFEQASRLSRTMQTIDRRPYTVTSIVVSAAELFDADGFAAALEGPSLYLRRMPAGRPTIHTYNLLDR